MQEKKPPCFSSDVLAVKFPVIQINLCCQQGNKIYQVCALCTIKREQTLEGTKHLLLDSGISFTGTNITDFRELSFTLVYSRGEFGLPAICFIPE